MPNSHHDDFTVFGGMYPAERHNDHPAQQCRKPAGNLCAFLVIALIVGSITAIGTVAGIHAAGSGFTLASDAADSALPAPRELLW